MEDTRTLAAPVSTAAAGVKNVLTWAVQIALAILFVDTGIDKLTSAPEMVALFDAVGAGQWLRYVTGGMEVTGAALLLIPGFAGIGALLVGTVVVGATLSHLLVLGGAPVVPLVLTGLAGTVVWARRGRTLRLLGK
jgi:putative oxidoreductase